MPARRQTADDACPGALRLHAAADGPLARVRLPGGMLTGRQLGVLGDIAEQHGDGALELTSRANVQLRALRIDPTELATRLAAAGLLPSLAHETVRNIAAPPLADAETRGLVEALDHALCADDALAALPGRFLFAVGRTPLSADVTALPVDDTWAIVLAGTDVGLRVPADQVVATMLGAARAFLEERAGREPKPWRVREITGGAELIAARLGGTRPAAAHSTDGTRTAAEPPVAEVRPPAEPTAAGAQTAAESPTAETRTTAKPTAPGARTATQSNAAGAGPAVEPGAAEARAAGGLAGRGREVGRVVGKLVGPGLKWAAVAVLVPLGRLTRVQLEVLARAERLAVAPWGGVVVLDLDPAAADRWVGELRDAGLVTEGDSKWVGVTTCAGRPGCGKALADVREDAARVARFVDGLPVHWVGCERGCGAPADRHVRVEATASGYLVDGDAVEGGLGEVVAARRA